MHDDLAVFRFLHRKRTRHEAAHTEKEIAPGAGGTGWSMWLAFGVSQLYIVMRLLMKLQFIASQIALFQANLAHASLQST